MGKGAQLTSADPADVTEQPRVRQASVLFPLAGSRDQGLGAVRVIDWGRAGLSTRMTLSGPVAHKMGVDEEIEATIRAERLYGGCYPGTTEGPLMVELVLNELHHVSGASYTLALAIADKLTRGCLPRLTGRLVVATGHVRSDGRVDAVGRIAEKLEVVKHALERASIAAPTLVLPQANLDLLTAGEQRLLSDLIAAGARCEWVAALEDMDAAWPAEPQSVSDQAVAPESSRMVSSRMGWVIVWLAIGVLVVLISVMVYQRHQAASLCGQLSTEREVVARCWQPLPLILAAECRFEHQGGYRPWRLCESGTCLTGADQFRLVARPAAEGWLYVFHLDATDRLLEDLWPQQTPQWVRSGETIRLPLAGRTYHIDGRSAEERFFGLLTRRQLPESTFSEASSTMLAEFMDRWAERFVMCRDSAAFGD